MRDFGDATYELMPGLFDAAVNWPLRSEIYTDRAMASVKLQQEHRPAPGSVGTQRLRDLAALPQVEAVERLVGEQQRLRHQ